MIVMTSPTKPITAQSGAYYPADGGYVYNPPTGDIADLQGNGSIIYTGAGSTQAPIAKTAAFVMAAADATGQTYSNTGASGSVAFTTPPIAVAGMRARFYVGAAQNLVVTANTGQTIRNGADVSASGGTLTSNVIGNIVSLLAVSATQWVVDHVTGDWSMTQ